jgi:hypothetical protein
MNKCLALVAATTISIFGAAGAANAQTPPEDSVTIDILAEAPETCGFTGLASGGGVGFDASGFPVILVRNQFGGGAGSAQAFANNGQLKVRINAVCTVNPNLQFSTKNGTLKNDAASSTLQTEIDYSLSFSLEADNVSQSFKVNAVRASKDTLTPVSAINAQPDFAEQQLILTFDGANTNNTLRGGEYHEEVTLTLGAAP